MSLPLPIEQRKPLITGRTFKRLFSGETLWHIPLVLLALAMFYPFLWMLFSAFKTTSEILAIPPTLWPQRFSTAGFVEIIAKQQVLRNFFNSVVVSSLTTVIAMVAASLGGFVLAHYQFRFKNLAFIMLISPMMIPVAVTVLPLYYLFTALQMQNTYQALILPSALSGFGIFLMRQFMQAIPTECLEAARMDGANDWTLYARVALPLTLNPLSGVAIFTFLTTWSQFWWPLMISSRPDMRTMTQAVAMTATQIGQRFDVLAAGAVLAVLPIVIVFAFATRQVVQSVAFSGMKEG
jgi:ABC-type glycerol-3-phosphate transport system permease component